MDLTTGSQTSYRNPILKNTELIDCLKDVGCEVTKQELQEPQRNKEKLRTLFLSLLEFCTGKTEADFQASPAVLAKAESMEYPSLHEDFSELKFFLALRDFLTVCGYHGFSFRDLHAPTAKRLRDQLSAIINMAKFRDEQSQVYFELCRQRTTILENLEEAKNENTVLVDELTAVENESQAKFQEKDSVMKECMELEMEISKNNKKQSQAREEAEALKKKANQLKDELDTALWALQEAEAEEENLRLQVVSSPDRRKMELEHKKEMLDHEKLECENMENQLQTFKTKTIHVQRATKDLQAARASFEELHAQAHKYAALIEKLEEALANIKKYENEAAETEAETEEVQRTLQRTDEKIVHQRKQHAMQIKATQEALDAAKSQLLLVEKDRREAMARVERSEAEVREIEAAIDQERAKTDDQVQALIAEYKETERVFLERNSKRMDAIGVE